MAWRIFVYKDNPTFWPAESTVYVAKPGEVVKEYIVNEANVPTAVGASSGGIAAVNWGDIDGNITDQTDLISYIASRLSPINSSISTINSSISTINAELNNKLDKSSEYIEITTGDTIDAGSFVFMASDGFIYTAFKDVNETIGYVTDNTSAGNSAKVYFSKKIYSMSTLSVDPGTPLYLSSSSTPEVFDPYSKCPQRIGIAIDTNHFLLDIHPWRPSDKPFNTFALQRRQLNY